MLTRWELPLAEFTCAHEGVHLAAVDSEKFLFSANSSGGKMGLRGPVGRVGNADWHEAKYLVADLFHQNHDVLVIVVEFFRNEGTEQSDRIEAHFGVLPNVPTRLCFPLSALNSEQLFLSRYPGAMQTVLRGGSGLRANEVNHITVGTVESVSPRSFTISNVHLTTSEPDFLTPTVPVSDELGQYLHREWPSKTHGHEQLVAYLQSEDRKAEDSVFYSQHWGRFGGWKALQFEATGFFHTHHDGNRWWLVDPEGYAFISIGFDCVQPGETMKVDGMEHLTSWLPPKEGAFTDAWREDDGRYGSMFSYAIANLIRAFGENWWESWAKITLRRHREWGFNTVANWSEQKFIRYAKTPYVWPLSGFPTTTKLIFRDFPDVFSDEYREQAHNFAKQLETFSTDEFLVGYFLRNEPHWAFVDELNIALKMLEHPENFASKEALIHHIQSKYCESVQALNEAWNTRFSNFDELRDPHKIGASLSEQAHIDLDEFSGMMIEEYVRVPAMACKKVDPYHLNLGMRYAWISTDHLLRGSEHFDVFSINTYQMEPDANVVRHIHEITGLPVMIGEFHHGAADVGMLANGIRGVPTQADRGKGYQFFVEQGVSIPELVGMHYFQWNDQALLGRFDGENYQIGAVDVCHHPYEDFVAGVVTTHLNIYRVATGEQEPYAVEPPEIPRTGF